MNAQTDAKNAGQIIRRRGGEIVEAEGQKSGGGKGAPKKMLKMKVDPEMYMKTKERATICPTQKTTFLHSCTPFYTETHEFCRKRRLLCHSSTAGERSIASKCRS
jgi:hypothetical protein